MTENPNQPANNPTASLDEQLDTLLSRIEREEPGAVPAEIVHPPAASSDESLDAMIDRQVDDAIVAAEAALSDAEPAPSAGVQPVAGVVSSDALADQVQAMLNEASGHQPHPLDTDALDQAAGEVADIDGELSGSFTAPQAVADEVAVLAAEEAADAQVDTDLAELDRLIADEADEAITGAFESPQTVAAQADETPAGTFESPAQFADPDGSSAAVARELDEQPEKSVAAKAAAKRREAAAGPPQPSFLVAMLPKLERTVRHTCALLNAPLNKLNPEWRNTVGYAGLLIMLTALTLIAAGIFFDPTLEPSSKASANGHSAAPAKEPGH